MSFFTIIIKKEFSLKQVKQRIRCHTVFTLKRFWTHARSKKHHRIIGLRHESGKKAVMEKGYDMK